MKHKGRLIPSDEVLKNRCSKYEFLKFETMEDIQQEITNEIAKNLSNEFDKIFIKGLELKGFTFENRVDTENFIKENCFCADDLHNQQKTFYVKGVPFLLHNYKVEIEPIVNFKNKTSITANYGYYKYL